MEAAFELVWRDDDGYYTRRFSSQEQMDAYIAKHLSSDDDIYKVRKHMSPLAFSAVDIMQAL